MIWGYPPCMETTIWRSCHQWRVMWFKQCHEPPMTGNWFYKLFRVMTGGWFIIVSITIPQNGWCLMETPSKMDVFLGYPHGLDTPRCHGQGWSWRITGSDWFENSRTLGIIPNNTPYPQHFWSVHWEFRADILSDKVFWDMFIETISQKRKKGTHKPPSPILKFRCKVAVNTVFSPEFPIRVPWRDCHQQQQHSAIDVDIFGD